MSVSWHGKAERERRLELYCLDCRLTAQASCLSKKGLSAGRSKGLNRVKLTATQGTDGPVLWRSRHGAERRDTWGKYNRGEKKKRKKKTRHTVGDFASSFSNELLQISSSCSCSCKEVELEKVATPQRSHGAKCQAPAVWRLIGIITVSVRSAWEAVSLLVHRMCSKPRARLTPTGGYSEVTVYSGSRPLGNITNPDRLTQCVVVMRQGNGILVAAGHFGLLDLQVVSQAWKSEPFSAIFFPTYKK